jgi:hypothetical protein
MADSVQLIEISQEQIQRRNISALAGLAALPPEQLLKLNDNLALELLWPRQAEDPRELSELPECRLWSLRADAAYPWLALLLQRSSGQLSRHVAMLVPHGFSQVDGIQFNADALSLWISHRLFLLDHWGQERQLAIRPKLVEMAAALGFELDQGFWPQGLAEFKS